MQAQLALWLSSTLPNLGDILAAHVRMDARFEPVFLHVEHNVRDDLRVRDLSNIHGTVTVEDWNRSASLHRRPQPGMMFTRTSFGPFPTNLAESP